MHAEAAFSAPAKLPPLPPTDSCQVALIQITLTIPERSELAYAVFVTQSGRSIYKFVARRRTL